MANARSSTVAGQVVEDILDGYFPLGESLRQFMARQGAEAALVVMTHAPILDLPDRPGTAPVPLRMEAQVSGLIRRLMVIARLDGAGDMDLCGLGSWRWHDVRQARPLTRDSRLAEPAFVRGIALREAGLGVGPWLLQGSDGTGRLWGLPAETVGIVPEGAEATHPVHAGTIVNHAPSTPHLIVSAQEAETGLSSDRMTRDWTNAGGSCSGHGPTRHRAK